MKALYGFGLTQEDERTVASALCAQGQTVLCVASAGDIPLSLLARGVREVISVDISEEQLHLCRLKASALECLDRDAAAGLLGFTPVSKMQREPWFSACISRLPKDTADFWKLHEAALCACGAVWCGRYEQFIRKLQGIIRLPLGGAFDELARCGSLEEQELIFDRRIGRLWLRALFRVAFSRKVYADRGIDRRGLANRSRSVPLGEEYYAKLRSFCTATTARLNPWLQIHTLGRLISLDAAPHYLGAGFAEARHRTVCAQWVQGDLMEYVRNLPEAVTRVYLSNLPDWCTLTEFQQLLRELVRKLPSDSRIVWACLHTDPPLPPDITTLVVFEDVTGSAIAEQDRFPFYTYKCLRTV